MYQLITNLDSYLGIPIAVIFFFGHMIVTGSRFVKPHEADFYTGKDIIEKQFDDYAALEAEKKSNANSGWSKFYYRYISWLF